MVSNLFANTREFHFFNFSKDKTEEEMFDSIPDFGTSDQEEDDDNVEVTTTFTNQEVKDDIYRASDDI